MKVILVLYFTLKFVVGLEYFDKKEQLTCILMFLLVWFRLPECFSSVAQKMLAFCFPTKPSMFSLEKL